MSGSRRVLAGSLGLGVLVLIALACQEPRIPTKRSPRPEQTTSAPIGQQSAGEPSAPKSKTPPPADAPKDDDGDDDGDDHADLADDTDAEPDAGIDEPQANTSDDAPPGTNANPPTAGQGGSTPSGAGGALAPDPITAPDPDIEVLGSWTGHVVDILGPMFDLCMEITQVGTAGAAGTTDYFNGTTCGGELSFIEMKHDTYSFSERITWGGPCIPAGRIDMRLNSDGTLDWEWFRSGAEVPQETGIMERVDACPE